MPPLIGMPIAELRPSLGIWALPERIMIPWIVGFVIAGIAAGIGFGALCVRLRDRHVRLMLGIPEGASGDLGQVQARLAAQAVVDTEMKINAAAPRLSAPQRRRLALALARSRGLLSGQLP
jgi:hypothetical protein